jgi:histidinol-phosphate aminotransferase
VTPRGNFLLVQVRDSTALAATVLDRGGVLVRDCAAFGLPGHLRVSVGSAADTRRLLECLDNALEVTCGPRPLEKDRQ